MHIVYFARSKVPRQLYGTIIRRVLVLPAGNPHHQPRSASGHDAYTQEAT